MWFRYQPLRPWKRRSKTLAKHLKDNGFVVNGDNMVFWEGVEVGRLVEDGTIFEFLWYKRKCPIVLRARKIAQGLNMSTSGV